MVNYPARTYPNGTVLTVVRRGEADIHGDRTTDSTHTIGPCDIKWLNTSEDNSEGEQIQITGQVTAPAGSDVLSTDAITHPDGRKFRIDGEVTSLAPNPFTGWATGVRFVITHAR